MGGVGVSGVCECVGGVSVWGGRGCECVGGVWGGLGENIFLILHIDVDTSQTRESLF